MTEKVGPDCLFAAVGRHHPRLDVCSSSSAISVLGPSMLHTASQGPPGKANRKKLLRGSRRDAERDSSPFSFTLSFLKGHAKQSRKGNIRTERSVRRR